MCATGYTLLTQCEAGPPTRFHQVQGPLTAILAIETSHSEDEDGDYLEEED